MEVPVEGLANDYGDYCDWMKYDCRDSSWYIEANGENGKNTTEIQTPVYRISKYVVEFDRSRNAPDDR